MNSSKQIRWGAILSYASIAFNIVTGLIYTPWMVATIGQSQYGLYTLANSLITLFLVDFGLSSATSRYLSKYNAEGDQEGAERFLGAVYKLYMLIDGIIFIILLALFFFLDSIYVNLTPTEMEQLKVVYIICALFSVINFPCVTFSGILNAYEQFVPLKVADVLYRLLNIVLTVIALLMGYRLYALVTIHAAVGLLVLLYKFLVIRKTVPLRINFKNSDKGLYKDIFNFSIWVTVGTLAGRLVFNITPSILGIVASSGAIAVFGVVTVIEGYAYTITTAINDMFMPRISRIMVKETSQDQLNPLFLSMGKFQYALNGLIIAGFTVIGQRFVTLWMGQDYSQAYLGILLVLLPGMFYNPLQIGHTTMTVTNKVKVTALIHLAAGIINVVLSFILSSFLGVTGACLSIGIAYFVRDIMVHIFYHRMLPLDIPGFAKTCYLRMSVPILLTIAFGMAVNKMIADAGWTVLLLKAIILCALYCVLMYALGLEETDRKQIRGFLKKK